MQALEDIQEIMRLKTAYVNGSDGGWPGKLSHTAKVVADLFVEDGTWEAKGFVKCVGRKQIHAAFSAMRFSTPLAVHLMCNPDIRVNGDRARGAWSLLALARNAPGALASNPLGRDTVTTGQYQNTFIRTPKGWRFKSLTATMHFSGPYKDGWTRLIQNGGLKLTQK